MTSPSVQPVEVQISTGEYKIKPLKAAARELLGYPHPIRVPAGVFAEQAIGISVDEVHRAKDSDVRYLRNIFPFAGPSNVQRGLSRLPEGERIRRHGEECMCRVPVLR